ncbi:flagellar biosynthetic protein FliR [Azohydromonas sediminis]|uniref:flagellar biosynthetic protein FliR n=1 Tax=Azohydromonas sediminis TaxID=2259674 RepID=UPI000E651A52|nr:flagellar biosynthetic protein FliR [Azohydromonas sediminis]
MLTFTDAQLLAWVTPLLWPFLRVLAMFTALPVLGTRTVPLRVRIALAFFIALAAQPMLPPLPPEVAAVALDAPAAALLVAQQVLVGLSLGFAVRIVFAAVEFAGEIVGLQMGLNFAGFFDPVTASQTTATSRFFGTAVAWLFVVINGHLIVIAAVVASFAALPIAPEPLAFVRQAQPQVWGAEVFRLGLWIALPIVAMLLFVNLVLGLISRVAAQMNIFAIGFPITVGVGLLGMLLTMPMMQAPFTIALEAMLARFQ